MRCQWLGTLSPKRIRLYTYLQVFLIMLVTALEANTEVPKMALVTERLLHEEQKQISKDEGSSTRDKALTLGHGYKKRGPRCHNCGKFGHIKRNCRSPPKEREFTGLTKPAAKESPSAKVAEACSKRESFSKGSRSEW